MELLKNVVVQAIIGPQGSAEAESIAEFGTKYHVPVISFSATSSALSRGKKPYFIGMTYNDTYQSRAIASVIQSFRWREVALVYEDTEYAIGIISYMIDVFQANGIRVAHHSVIHPSDREDQMMEKLQVLSTMQTRVFLLHMSYSLAPLFFRVAEKLDLMVEGNAWIITEGLTNMLGSLNVSVIDSMYGVLGVKSYIPPSAGLTRFWEKLKNDVHESGAMDDSKLSCLHAYDSVWMLAKAVELVSVNKSFGETERNTNISLIGEELRNVISRTKFRGLSGDIHLVNNQLQSPVFKILNINGRGEGEIGYWIPMLGISQQADASTKEKYERSKTELRSVIWPGDSTKVPNGWGKKLIIAVPLKDSFKEFVDVRIEKNQTVVTGYCVDVFIEVMKKLPYKLDYEFVPFGKGTGEYTSSYDHLLEQVALKKFDAAIGDITMTAKRLLSVEFSLPYTNGGVSMLVPIRYEENNFVFFNPFSIGVWMVVILGFTITKTIDWLYENVKKLYPLPDHTASPPQVPPPPEAVDGLNNASRLFMNTTAVKALSILFSVYVQLYVNAVSELQFTTVDVHDLLKNGDFVGYRKGSLAEMILKQLKFDDSRIKIYHSAEEFEEALDKGSKHGGVAAMFDEMPYIKLLTKKYCKKYTRVGPIYRMEGFAFAFPKGSPLVSDVSGAVLPVVEEARMAEIESKWLGNENSCPDPKIVKSGARISPRKFGGVILFVVLVQLSSLLQFFLTLFNRRSSNRYWILFLQLFHTESNQNARHGGQSVNSVENGVAVNMQPGPPED